MPLLEDHTASFIVRIRRETSNAPGARGDWRGSIEHVPSGRRAFFLDLGAVVQFMKPHLTELGIDTASRFWEQMSDDAQSDAAAPAADPPAITPRRRTQRRAESRS